MKKFITFLFAVLISALSASAYDFMVDSIAYNYNSDGTSVTVTEGRNYTGAIDIPSSVTYSNKPYSVTSIGEESFSGCRGLTSVTIPNSVITIGQSAFYGCTGLTSVTIGNSVTTIGNSAFSYCIGLTSVIIPNAVTSIGEESFSGCRGLTSVSIGNSVTTIGIKAFRACTSLTSVTIPNSVTTIGGYAFYECTGLTTMTIPNSVTSIGDWAFYNCTGLTSVTIGKSVTSIGDYAFNQCSFLENLVAMRERPIIINSNVFNGIPKASCDLHVRQGSKIRYEYQDVWKDFLIIVEDADDWTDVSGGSTSSGIHGDVNGDGVVTASDVTAVYNIILGL